MADVEHTGSHIALPPEKGSNPRVKNFNADIKKECESLGVPYVDGDNVLKDMKSAIKGDLLTEPAVTKLAQTALQAAYFANTSLRRR